MIYPSFFDDIETITLQDELSNFLGTFSNGVVTFSYLDIVKSAGHSCPTVAGAYLCTLYGLKALYDNEIPKRGEIIVEFKEDIEDGVAGVIGNVISQITGATTINGFKGIGNKYNRCDLMYYKSNIQSNVRFSSPKSNKYIDVYYNPSSIQIDNRQMELMSKTMRDIATKEEQELFQTLWQQRVENIFKNSNQIIKTEIHNDNK